MSIHDRFLALAATAIDFRLSPEDQHALREHLATCPSCPRFAASLRDDAAALTHLPIRDTPLPIRFAVQRAAAARSPLGRPSLTLVLATGALLVALVGGAFAAGGFLDRRTAVGPDASVPVTADHRTLAPSSLARTPRPTSTRTPARPATASWSSLGNLASVFGSDLIASIAAVPRGGFVAIGQDTDTLAGLVWTSADGISWDPAPQIAGVFGDGVLTDVVPGGRGLVTVGWDATVGGGPQRAVWTSVDGKTWTRSTDPSATIGSDSTLTLTQGPSGLIAWSPSGRAWFSRDGTTWRKTTIGRSGIADVAVGDGLLVAVGAESGTPWIATSKGAAANPQWTSAGLGTASADATRIGAESAADGTLLVWVGTTRYAAGADGTWRAAGDGKLPAPLGPANVGSGASGFLAVSGVAANGDGGRAWTWDGSGAWTAVSGPSGSGTTAPLAIAPDGDGWLVVARDTARAWSYSVTR